MATAVLQPIGWACTRRLGGYGLRRGEWYPVAEDDGTRDVFLHIRGRAPRLAVPRHELQIRRHRPEHFTVIIRAPDEPEPARPVSVDLGRVYAVCPRSGSRIGMTGRPNHIRCPNCGHAANVAWESSD